MKERAYAKINLSLDVFNVRENGYHDLKSIMVPINFFDDLYINKSENNHYYCNRNFIRFDEHNSIIKMINILKDRYDIKDNHSIILKKMIPVRAGLGGGTADAAATLRLFQRMYNLNLSKEEIAQICLSVGADVLFNYYNYPAVVSGIGDQLERITIKDQYYALLVVPRGGVSTREAYELLDMNTCDHPDIDALRSALENGDDINGLLGNSLQQSAFKLNKEIEPIIISLKQDGFENVLMTGSGAGVFAISKDESKIKKAYDDLFDSDHYVRFTSLLLD